jgi:hypothetical protein
MEERTTSSSYVYQELIPAVSAALSQLKRSPGKDEGWVDGALRVLERERPYLHDRLKRRLGFALRLLEIAGIGSHERAEMTLGIFFYELADEQTRAGTGKPSRPWTEHLIRNESWLARSYHIAEALASPGWSAEHGTVIVVAKIAIAYDTETRERNGRPLAIIQDMFSHAQTPAAEEILPLLWTEEGQELCDHHFRRQPYRIDIQEIKHAFETLKRITARPLLGEEPAAPMRFSTRIHVAPEPQEDEEMDAHVEPPERPRERARAVSPTPSNGVFEQRKRALRAGPGWGAILGDPSSRDEDVVRRPQAFSSERRPYIPNEPVEEPEPPEELWLPPPRPEPEPERPAPSAPPQEEVPKMAIRNIPATRPQRNDAGDITSRVEDLRLQLEQIQLASAQAQQLLASLAPQMEEFATWVADLEAVVGRWRPRSGDQQAA